MPIYKYKAITEDGSVITGEMFSATRKGLSEDLVSRGLFVTKISRNLFPELSRKPGLETLHIFLKEFTALLRSGLSVQDAIQVTAHERDAYLAGLLSQIRYDILRGKQLSHAFAKLADTFDPLLRSVVETGAQTGRLAESLKSYESLLARKIELRRKIRQAMYYPAFVISVITAILIVIFEFSLPRFVEMYADLDAELPSSTSFLLSMSNNFTYIISLILIVLVAIWVGWHHLRKKKWLREYIAYYSLKTPFVGKVQQSYLISLFGRTLSSLLASGTPLVEAVAHTAQALPNEHYTNHLEKVMQMIAKGAALTTAVRGLGIFPTAAEKLIEAGEKSGTLEDRLNELAEFYESDIDYRLGLVMTLVEPLLILITGIIVGVVVLIMYLPIFSLAGAV